MVDDIERIKYISPSSSLCEACIKGKQARLPFQKEKDKGYTKRPLFVVHTDVCGPIALLRLITKI